MDSKEIRRKFLKFYEERGHKVVPSSALIPDDDPSVLFTTAGMQQFKPYYVGQKDALTDFGSLNVTSIQKCLRTSDIEEVGDPSHLTFFEMLGNFSFGGYWKEEAIKFAYEFVTIELGLKIDYVSVFAGQALAIPPDLESEKIWKSIDPQIEVRKFGRDDNFWGPTGASGPCGPTTEIYVNGIEIWNIVFNQYYQNEDQSLTDLKIKGIDTGLGLERLLKVVEGTETVFETDLFKPIIDKIKSTALNFNEKSERIIADHIRAAVFLMADGVSPSNTDRGYILRRLIRRAVVYARRLGLKDDQLLDLVDLVVEIYKGVYLLQGKIVDLKNILITEMSKFNNTLEKGLKEFEKLKQISGQDAFVLFSTYGYPFEMILELAEEKGLEVDKKEFEAQFQKHRVQSRQGALQKFRGGLANHEPQTIRLHTAHHLLLAALKQVLGQDIKQRGSNITEQRLRLDFSFDRKLTEEEKKKVEDLVNQKIKDGLPVLKLEMSKIEAEKLGAEMEFGAKYEEVVTVYAIGGDPRIESEKVFSAEFCGGPHVKNTAELDFSSRAQLRDNGPFKIQKEEAVAAGTRRIKAVLEL